MPEKLPCPPVNLFALQYLCHRTGQADKRTTCPSGLSGRPSALGLSAEPVGHVSNVPGKRHVGNVPHRFGRQLLANCPGADQCPQASALQISPGAYPPRPPAGQQPPPRRARKATSEPSKCIDVA